MSVPVAIDARGTVLEVGQRVAYNFSGDVMPGEIVDLKKGTQYGRTIVVIHVKLLQSVGKWFPVGHISKVRNQRSVLVLKEDEN